MNFNKIVDITIDPNDTMIHALKLMDKSFKRLLLVVDKGKFFGLLSIGDIQRAIIRGVSLNESVKLSCKFKLMLLI